MAGMVEVVVEEDGGKAPVSPSKPSAASAASFCISYTGGQRAVLRKGVWSSIPQLREWEGGGGRGSRGGRGRGSRVKDIWAPKCKTWCVD